MTHVNYARGFALIEIMVTLGILAVLLSLGLFVSFDTYRGYVSRSERDTVVSILARARSRAMADIDQTSWGVCYIAPNYVLFSGSVCDVNASEAELVPASANASVTFSVPIIFAPLAATTTGGTVTIVQDGRTETITINYEGRIDW